MNNMDEERILSDLEDARNHVNKWNGMTSEDYENDSEFRIANDEYALHIMKAVRAGLEDHPKVKPYFEELKRLGQKDFLRRFGKRVGAEVGVKKLKTVGQIELEATILRLIKKGKSRVEVQDVLTNEGRIEKMSREGFRKKLITMGLNGYFV